MLVVLSENLMISNGTGKDETFNQKPLDQKENVNRFKKKFIRDCSYFLLKVQNYVEMCPLNGCLDERVL